MFCYSNEFSFSTTTHLHFDSQVLGLNTHFAPAAHFMRCHLLSHGGSIGKGFEELLKMFLHFNNNIFDLKFTFVL